MYIDRHTITEPCTEVNMCRYMCIYIYEYVFFILAQKYVNKHIYIYTHTEVCMCVHI